MNKLVDVIVNATIAAATHQINDGYFPNVKKLKEKDKLVWFAIKDELKLGLKELLEDLKDAQESRVPEEWLRHIVNVNCNLMAAKALKKIENKEV